MAGKNIFELLRVAFYYSSNILKLTPTSISRVNHQQWIVSCISISKRIKCLWCLTLAVSFLITIAELYLSLYDTSSRKLFKILYHTFQFLVKAASNTLIYTFNIKSIEISFFLKCIFKKYSTVDLPQFQGLKSADSKLLQMFAYFIAITNFVFMSIFLPLVFLLLPRLHESFCIQFLCDSYNSIWFKVYLFAIQMLFLLPISAIGTVATTPCLVALGEINFALRNLW